MRVVLDGRVATRHFPGIARQAVELSEGLLRVAPDLDLVVLEDVTAPPETRLAIAAPRAPVAASVFSPAQQWRVPARLKALEADLYHSLFYLMPYRCGVPTLFTCHDMIPFVRPEVISAPKRWAYGLLHRLADHASDAVISVSENSARDMVRYIGTKREKIHVVHIGIDPLFAPPAAADAAAMRRALGIEVPYFLFVGANRPHKNLLRVVDAYARVREALGAAAPALVIAGPWDARYPEARTRAERLPAGSVRFVGKVPEAQLPALYGEAVATVFPSLAEGAGLPVLESMACGTPVVTSDRSALPETAGDAAILVPPEDVEAIARGMLELVRDTAGRAERVARGRAWAARWTWDQCARETAELYRRFGRAR